MRKAILGGRILLTTRPGEFTTLAPVFDLGIIALDKLAAIDPSQDALRNRTVRAINTAIIEHHLWRQPKAFIVTLNATGMDSRFEEIC